MTYIGGKPPEGKHFLKAAIDTNLKPSAVRNRIQRSVIIALIISSDELAEGAEASGHLNVFKSRCLEVQL